jgi:hypothetical protein
MMAQLAFVKRRIQTMNFASHESRILADMILLLAQTIGGEEANVASLAGGVLQDGVDVPVHLQESQRRGGIEIAPGVVQYPAPTLPAGGVNVPGGIQTQAQLQPAPIDVQAGMMALTGEVPPTRPDLAPPTPVPGSLAAQALGGLPVNAPVEPPIELPRPGTGPAALPTPEEAKAIQEMEDLLGQGDPDAPVPDPSETKVVITPAKG